MRVSLPVKVALWTFGLVALAATVALVVALEQGRLRGRQEMWVQEFRVLGPDDEPLDLEDVGDRVAEAIGAVYRGVAESDPLNRLVITVVEAGLLLVGVVLIRRDRESSEVGQELATVRDSAA